jgi:hypothetical protein
MADFEHQRHKPLTPLARPREVVLCCAPMRSNVNLSNIVRTAGCCGITRLIACGNAKIDRKDHDTDRENQRDHARRIDLQRDEGCVTAIHTTRSHSFGMMDGNSPLSFVDQHNPHDCD